MEELKLSQLKPGAPLEREIYHSSGEVLLSTAGMLTKEILHLLEKSGITEVLSPEPGEDPGEFILNAKNLVIPIDDVNIGQRMTQPVFSRRGALLIEAGAVVSERMSDSLRRRGVDKIYVRKSTKELGLDVVQAFRRGMRKLTGAQPTPINDTVDDSRRIAPEDCTPEAIDEMIDAGGEVVVPRAGTPLLDAIERPDPLALRSAETKDGYMAMYESAVVNTSKLFKTFEEREEVPEEKVGRLAREVVGALVEDRDLLLNLSNFKTEHNYLLGHSLGVTVLSISVAAALGYNRKMVLEMGHAAYLHDVGMLRIASEVIAKPGKLSTQEMMQVRRHPVYGLDMLQSLVGHRSGLAGTIPIVAYQSHERANGSGYPKRRKDRVIHDFAKIVGVCDAYEAMTSKRSWRQPMLPYRAMEELVVMASRGLFDANIVKALLQCLSLFPIGSWVELSDDSSARVVSSSEENYTRPVVSVMYRKQEPLQTPERVNLSREEDISIVRPIPEPDSVGDLMEGF